jgi:DNA polymerase-1
MGRVRHVAGQGLSFEDCLERIRKSSSISLDLETTGLRPYHGDRIFAITVANATESFYFGSCFSDVLRAIFSPFNDIKSIIFHNAKFDLSFIDKYVPADSFEKSLARTLIIDTKSMARVERNDHFSYSLEDCAERAGLPRKLTDEVWNWLEANEAFDWIEVPGKNKRIKHWYFDRVPKEIMIPYALTDAELTYDLGLHLAKEIQKASLHAKEKNLPALSQVFFSEAQLTQTLFAMERYGVKIDREYTVRAAQFEVGKCSEAAQKFEGHTGQPFKNSGKLFAEVFASDKSLWSYTEKGNPSFDSDALKKFAHPAAKAVLEYRDAKSRADFYHGFLFFADSHDFIHPNFNSDGTGTGRLSSSEPNFQNLTDDEEVEREFKIRRAIIPPSDEFTIFSFDFQAMEYRMMLELAARLLGRPGELLLKVKDGADVHEATAQLASVKASLIIPRKSAKMSNFLTIYGGGDQKLADGLGCTLEEARAIRQAIFAACPEIKYYMRAVMDTAKTRGYVFNWHGRRSYFQDPNFAYKALNYLIQGGCADVTKIAMNRIQALLREKGYRSRMVMTVHDELVFYIHQTEIHLVPIIRKIMIEAFPAQYLPMDVSIGWGPNLADLAEYKGAA